MQSCSRFDVSITTISPPLSLFVIVMCSLLRRESMAFFALVEMFGVIRLHEDWCFSTRLWRSACKFFMVFSVSLSVRGGSLRLFRNGQIFRSSSVGVCVELLCWLTVMCHRRE